MDFTGERFIPTDSDTEISLEHLHRYILAADLCQGAVVLDAASGAGYGSALLSAKAAKVYGVDVDPEAVEYAADRFGNDVVSFHAASVTALPFADHMFDVVVSFETLEHITQHEEMLGEFARVLKRDGLLIISTPDKPIYNQFLAEPNEFHVRELTREEFEALLMSRFKAVSIYGQRIAFGSLVVSATPDNHPLETIRRLEGGGLARQSAEAASMYLIALCSNGALSTLATGIYEGGVPQNAMSALLGGIGERDGQLREARQLALEANALIEQLESEAAESAMLLQRLVSSVQRLSEGLDEQQRFAFKTVVAAAKARAARRSPGLKLRRFLGDLYWSARFARTRPRLFLRFIRSIGRLRASGLIDTAFYAPQKAATAWPLLEDARHQVMVGPELDPDPMFSGGAYLRLNDDIAGRWINPLLHYLENGLAEGRQTAPSDRADVGPGGEGRLSAQVLRTPRAEDRPRYPWPLAELKPGQAFGAFDARPDDDMLAVGREGQDFINQFDLLSERPRFAQACAALNALTANPAVIGPDQDDAPKASIVIPVYGQLAYTLNCLHALLAHGAHHRFEILIGDDASVDETPEILSRLDRVRYVRHPQNQGFIDNCNATAALARGEYLVFLNNDTRVAPGWLDALIDSFSLFPKAGLIGSKLFYPDGSLQEAGGIFWRDGSAWNYGRDDDPNRPRYCYARQVDYVSGAAIAIPVVLWRELDGFDPIYRPAYCEDSDIAFRIRAKGLQTWMQPLSKAIHYEGKTSGTDLTQGAKAYQVANMKTLARRWEGALQAFSPNGERPMLARDRGVQKRVLIIDATTPTPNEDAGSVTTVMNIQMYQEMGYKVYFVPLHNFLYRPGLTDALMRMGVECVYHPYTRSLDSFLAETGRYLDLVQVFRVEVAEAALESLRRLAPQAPIIFHNMDMHHLRMERQATVEGDAQLMQAAQAMKARELAVIGAVDCMILHSETEMHIVRTEAPQAQAVIFPFMTPLVGTSAAYADRVDVMFLGGYLHVPNVDAALFLAREVWPLVRQDLSGARLMLVGASPPDEVRALASEDILVTGQVEDLRPWFDRARVLAAGIRYGAGVKGKVATAMSHGVPVVATTIAAEGMELEHERHVMIADDPADFARRIVELYRDEALWTRLSQAGLTFVRDRNSVPVGIRIQTEAIGKAQHRLRRRALERARAIAAQITA